MQRKILIVIGVLIIGLQFFRGNPPEVNNENPGDILLTEAIDGELAITLRQACYDCHSMESRYPWYTYVTPVSWFVFGHVEKGRKELNFSEWSTMSQRRQLRKLEELVEEVGEGEMPLPSYTLIHGEARLTAAQRQAIGEWAKELSRKIQN